MINALTTSLLKSENIEQVVNLVNSAYRGEASKKGWTTEADLIKGTLRIDIPSLKELLQQTGAIMLTCHNDSGELAGCVYLQKKEMQLYLGMLSVSPTTQAQGIGKQLLHAAEGYAKKENCNAIIMDVIDKRQELIEWYIRNGYTPTGETKPFHSNPAFGIPVQPLKFIVLEKLLR